jgi:cell division protein FtsB
MSVSLLRSSRSLRRWLLIGVAVVLLLWITFFDSHSLIRRYQWHAEHDRLTQENQELRARIEALEAQLDQPLSDEVVERIAREEYGMKRPGETVYRIESD